MDLDRKTRIKENLIAEAGEQEAETIWNRAKEILKEIYENGQEEHTRI